MKLNLLQPKRIFEASVFSVILLFPLSGLAITVQEVPNPREEYGGWVSDLAGILSNETEAQINQMISELEAKQGTEMAVVTVPETSPAASPKTFATELFNYWGIGKQGQDNGVLFLISVSDRRVEIETGYGVEAILPDAKVGNIIDTQIIPRFKQGDFPGGTLAGTKALIVALNSEQSLSGNPVISPNPQTTPNNTNDGMLWGVLAGGGLLALTAGSAVYFTRPRKILIAPDGRTRKSKGNYTFLCASCQQPMQQVDDSTIQPYLSKPEITAQKLGSVKFQGWKCPSCSQKQTSQIHIVAQESRSSRFRQCPRCQELTVTRDEKTVMFATPYSSGKRLITDVCHSCSYYHQQEKIIPPLPPPPPPSSSGGSFGGGAGSSSGGSFGGGSSGGGGAGGSW